LEKSQQPMKKLVDQLTNSHSTKVPPRDIIDLTQEEYEEVVNMKTPIENEVDDGIGKASQDPNIEGVTQEPVGEAAHEPTEESTQELTKTETIEKQEVVGITPEFEKKEEVSTTPEPEKEQGETASECSW
jgi:hypothetical protein